QQQRVVEFEEEVERAIETWVNGRGANLEAEHRGRACELGYDPEIVGRAWCGAKQRKLAKAADAVVPLRRRKPDGQDNIVSISLAKPKPEVQPSGLPLFKWSEVIRPANASDLERLTYVPGLTGQITEWILRGARRPNRMMALGVATVVVGTLIGR